MTGRKEGLTMKGKIKTVTVQGKTYSVWCDTIMKGTYAMDENGVENRIAGGSYLRNELTIRKAIYYAYGLKSFRK